MSGINITFNKNTISISNDYDRRNQPVSLSEGETSAINEIYKILSEAHVAAPLTHLERRSDNYLTLVAFKNIDFLRIKIGKKSSWFSVDIYNIKDKFLCDPRLQQVKNKNQRHWKISISSFTDISIYADIIVAAYNWAAEQSSRQDG